MVSRNHKLRAPKDRQPPNRIAALRKAKDNMSQGDLAKLCNTGTSTIARWEAGDTGVDISQLRLLARALGVKPSEILEDEDMEIRLDAAARATLNSLDDQERDVVLRAATEIGKLVSRLALNRESVALRGDPKVATKLVDVWDQLTATERHRMLGLVEAARQFQPAPAIAAE